MINACGTPDVITADLQEYFLVIAEKILSLR